MVAWLARLVVGMEAGLVCIAICMGVGRSSGVLDLVVEDVDEDGAACFAAALDAC